MKTKLERLEARRARGAARAERRRPSTALFSATFVALVGFGVGACAKHETPPVTSETRLTSADVPRAAVMTQSAYGQFRDNARNDLTNLDRRIERLELRASTQTLTPEARLELRTVHAQRDALAKHLEETTPSTWESARPALDRQWNDLGDLVDSVAETLTDDAR